MSFTLERDAGERKRNPIPLWTILNSGSEDYIRSQRYLVITLPSEDSTLVWEEWDNEERVSKGITSLEETFQQLCKHWRDGTRYTSSLTEIREHPAYRAIIDLGAPVIPLIIQDLQETLDYWFDALCALTGENPASSVSDGDIEAIRTAWLRWAKEHLSEQDGYQCPTK